MSRITLYWKLGVQSIFIQPEYSNTKREREREERNFVDLRNVSQRRKALFSTRINNRSSGYMKTRNNLGNKKKQENRSRKLTKDVMNWI